MNKKIFKNLLINGSITDITVKNGKIYSLKKAEEQGIDMAGKNAFPGLIDIHIHGGLGLDITYDPECIEKLCRYLALNGITSWYPTTVTESTRVLERATAQKTNFYGANVLGFHTEGPFISNTGAMKKEEARLPDLDEFRKFSNVKIVTVAPELDGAEEFIRNCGATVCLGHSNADYETALSGFRAGAECLTHAFNVMPPFHHREPSLIGAAITADGYIQVISDGIHLHPVTVKALYRIFGRDRMILISDAMSPMGIEKDGIYDMNGKKMTVKNGVAYTDEGRLYGSTSNLFTCVRRAISFGIPENDAFIMASRTPARLMNLKNKGEIKVGADADFIITDKDGKLHYTVINGEIIR